VDCCHICSRLGLQLIAAVARVQELSHSLSDCQGDLAEEQVRRQELQATLASQTMRLAQLEAESTQARGTVTTLQGELLHKNRVAADLRDDMARAKKDVRALQVSLRAAEAHAADASATRELSQRLADMEIRHAADLKRKDAMLADANRQLNLFQIQMKTLQSHRVQSRANSPVAPTTRGADLASARAQSSGMATPGMAPAANKPAPRATTAPETSHLVPPQFGR